MTGWFFQGLGRRKREGGAEGRAEGRAEGGAGRESGRESRQGEQAGRESRECYFTAEKPCRWIWFFFVLLLLQGDRGVSFFGEAEVVYGRESISYFSLIGQRARSLGIRKSYPALSGEGKGLICGSSVDQKVLEATEWIFSRSFSRFLGPGC